MAIVDDVWHRKYRDDLKSTVSLQSKREVTSCGRFARPRTPNYCRNWLRLNFVKNVWKTVNFVEEYVLLPPGFQECFVLYYKTKMIWAVPFFYVILAPQSKKSQSEWKLLYFNCLPCIPCNPNFIYIPATFYPLLPPTHGPCSSVQCLEVHWSI